MKRAVCLTVAIGFILPSFLTELAHAGATVQLSPSVTKSIAPTGVRSAKMSGRLNYGVDEREIITGVVVNATTTDGRSLIVKSDLNPGYVTSNNPTNSASTYEGYVYDSRLKTFRTTVTFKRYYRINGNWYFDREYTVQSPSYNY